MSLVTRNTLLLLSVSTRPTSYPREGSIPGAGIGLERVRPSARTSVSTFRRDFLRLGISLRSGDREAVALPRRHAGAFPFRE